MEALFIALLSVLYYALSIYKWMLIISIILTWLVQFDVINSRNQFVSLVGNFLYRITEPVLAPIRRRLPAFGGIDISPILVFLAIHFFQVWIAGVLARGF